MQFVILKSCLVNPHYSNFPNEYYRMRKLNFNNLPIIIVKDLPLEYWFDTLNTKVLYCTFSNLLSLKWNFREQL